MSMNTRKPLKQPSLAERTAHTQQDKPALATGTDLVPVSKERTLADLVAEIKTSHSEAVGTIRAGAAAAIRAGKALIEAKALVKARCGHGYWTDYVTLECGLSIRTAQFYMFLTRKEPELGQLLASKAQNSAFLTQAQMLKLLGMAHQKRKRPKKSRSPA